jgi:hypothetical protein
MGLKCTKRPLNVPTFSIPRPSKIFPNWDFWFENIPSGNPDLQLDSGQTSSATSFCFKEVAPIYRGTSWARSNLLFANQLKVFVRPKRVSGDVLNLWHECGRIGINVGKSEQVYNYELRVTVDKCGKLQANVSNYIRPNVDEIEWYLKLRVVTGKHYQMRAKLVQCGQVYII